MKNVYDNTYILTGWRCNMKDKLMRFMYGRYGVDTFSRCIVGVGLVLTVITLFVNSSILSLLGIGTIAYAYFRILSRNIYKRSAENQLFLKKTAKIRQKFTKWKQLGIQSKTHHIYSCPSCKQKIRIPRGKGKIEVKCPKCGTTFIKRS